MKKLFLLFWFYLLHGSLSAQVTEFPTTNTEQQLENITENSEDSETEDDSYLQEMVQFIKNPVNLNSADEYLLKDLKVLSPLQIQNLISYRRMLGKFISIYELQAIPAWDLNTIRRVRPYIAVNNKERVFENIGVRLKKGEHSLLVRVSRVLERSKGYLLDESTATNYYQGSSQRLLLRYKYIYKNLLQYGIVAEKDGGEEFFRGSQKKGFDFYSAHLFMRNLGIIKSLALGDFTVNFGQGLIQWQSLAFRKGPDITATKRQSAVLRPYNSAGEINFHRGVGITIGKKNWEATFFGSYRKLDANLVPSDTLIFDDNISSFQTSGFHRTKSEIEDKNVQRQIAFGGNVSYQFKNLHIGLNGIRYHMKYAIIKEQNPYNLYALTGKSFGNYSLNYSYTYKNMHLFGEMASYGSKGLAFVNGLLISVSSIVDMSFFYRNISKKYQSLYSNAFTENTLPTNEKGLFSGISIRPAQQWQIDAYVDIYKFPWLKSRVDHPTAGSDYFIQVTYRPNRQFEMYSRYKRESKGINYNPDQRVLNPVINQPRQNWRTHFSLKLNQKFTLRSRTEIVWFDKKTAAASNGFLIYADVVYKPLLKPFSASIRLQYFETDNYDSRLYAFENDVLYSFSIPVFYDKGYRYYLNANYDITKKLTAWARVAQTFYPERTTIGSGLDEINGNRRTEVKFQLLYNF